MPPKYKRKTLCGGLNENGPLRFLGSGSIRRCGLVEVGVTFLEAVLLGWEWALRFQMLSLAQCHSLFLLPKDLVIELSATTLAQVPVYLCAAMLPAMTIMD